MGATILAGETSITIEINGQRASRCMRDVPGARDVDFSLTIGDETIDGEVTLTIDAYSRRYTACGDSPDTWIDGAAWARIRGREDYRDVLAALESATGAYADTHEIDP